VTVSAYRGKANECKAKRTLVLMEEGRDYHTENSEKGKYCEWTFLGSGVNQMLDKAWL
jgi:hypothetical protein